MNVTSSAIIISRPTIIISIIISITIFILVIIIIIIIHSYFNTTNIDRISAASIPAIVVLT